VCVEIKLNAIQLLERTIK